MSSKKECAIAPETAMSEAYKKLKNACFAKLDENKPIAVVILNDEKDVLQMRKLFEQERNDFFGEDFRIELIDDNDNSFVISPFYQRGTDPKFWIEIKQYLSVQRAELSGGRAPYEIKKSQLSTPQINTVAGIIERSEIIH